MGSVSESVKLWVLVGVATVLFGIAGWLAIELYNTNVKQNDIVIARLQRIEDNQAENSSNIKILFEKVKTVDCNAEEFKKQQQQVNEDVKQDVTTFWNMLIDDPTLLYKKKKIK